MTFLMSPDVGAWLIQRSFPCHRQLPRDPAEIDDRAMGDRSCPQPALSRLPSEWSGLIRRSRFRKGVVRPRGIEPLFPA